MTVRNAMTRVLVASGQELASFVNPLTRSLTCVESRVTDQAVTLQATTAVDTMTQ